LLRRLISIPAGEWSGCISAYFYEEDYWLQSLRQYDITERHINQHKKGRAWRQSFRDAAYAGNAPLAFPCAPSGVLSWGERGVNRELDALRLGFAALRLFSVFLCISAHSRLLTIYKLARFNVKHDE
jgi:hypothetical protein